VARRLGQGDCGGGEGGLRRVGARGHVLRRGGSLRHHLEFLGIEEQDRIGAGELHGQLIDIGFASAERGGQRQRHRPGARIDGAEESGGEFGARLGEQGDAVARPDAGRDQAVRARDRIGAQFGEGIGADQGAAWIVEIQAARAAGGIIQRRTQSREIGVTTRSSVIAGGAAKNGGVFNPGFLNKNLARLHSLAAPKYRRAQGPVSPILNL
jgi:hypothetical protein